MTNKEEYEDWRNDFFKRYYALFDPAADEKCPDGGMNSFPDGIISFDDYQNASPKVMFLNREAYDDEGYDVSEAILNKGCGHWCKSPMRFRIPEFLCIADITNHKSREEINCMTGDDIEVYYDSCDKPYKDKLLRSAAYVNVKKSKGLSKSTKADLYKNIEKGIGLLVEQITVINPDIIFAGNVVEKLLECFEPQISWGKAYHGQSIN